MALKGLLNSAYTIVFRFYSGGEGGGRKASQCGPAADYGNDGRRKGFRMPLHYPRYKKVDYEKMEEWKLDCLLREYGLIFNGSLEEKKDFAIGAFIWPGQMGDDN